MARRLAVELLEDRVCLSAYSLQVLAMTGQTDDLGEPIQTLGADVSINSQGRVVFTADVTEAAGVKSALLVSDGDGPRKISFLENTASRLFGFPQINDHNDVIARDIGGGFSFVRTWESDASQVPSFQRVIRASSGTSQVVVTLGAISTVYPALQFLYPGVQIVLVNSQVPGLDTDLFTFATLPSYSNDGGIAFIGQLRGSNASSLFLKLPDNDGIAKVADLTGGGFRPMVGDHGLIVMRMGGLPTDPIALFVGANRTDIATTAMGFTRLDNSPGISDDGEIVAFSGADAAGDGIFLHYVSTGETIRVAGVGGNGVLDPGETYTDNNGNGEFDAGDVDVGIFTSLGRDFSRVAVNRSYKASNPNLYTVAFAGADDSGVLGLNTLRHDRDALFDHRPPASHFLNVVNVGDAIVPLSGSIQSINVHDPLSMGGQIAFSAIMTSGAQIIVKAEPPAPAVVNVVTHGFGRDFFGPEFMDVWHSMEKTFNEMPDPGSALEGDVRTYVASWDSSSGWVAAFLSAVMEQFAQLEAATSTPGDALKWQAIALLARNYMSYQLGRAATLAEQAARTIVRDLERNGLIKDPLQSQNGEQIIHLVGHSRGAAVNARVAELLVQKQYVVDQYTSLDGYSRDWPGISSFLSDINIPRTISALGASVKTKVNYLVSRPLDAIALHLLQPYTALAAVGYNLPPAVFSDAFRELFDGTGLWQAPPRASSGFSDRLIKSSTGLGVAHFAIDGNEGIVEVYASSIDRPDPDDYILDNYLGMHRSDAAIVAAAANAEPLANATIQDAGFQDGDFEGLGSLQSDAAATVFPDFADDVYNLWKTMVTDPATTLATLWDFTGDVELVADGANTLAQLTQTADTSLGQQILVGDYAAALQFDLTIMAAQAGQVLEVLFNDEPLATIPLDDKPLAAAVPMSIPIAQLAGSDGVMTFRLTGPTAIPSVVRIDNIELTAPLAPADFDQDGEVDGADFLAWQRGMGTTSGAARADGDANGDGAVDGGDLTAWRDGFAASSSLASGLSTSTAAAWSANPPDAPPSWFIEEPAFRAAVVSASRADARGAAHQHDLADHWRSFAPAHAAYEGPAAPLLQLPSAATLPESLPPGGDRDGRPSIADKVMNAWPGLTRRASNSA